MYDIKKVLGDLRSARRKKVIVDTDTYNEVDDQYALAYLLQAKEAVEVLGVTAAPFHNWRSDSFADGMERSYNEIKTIVELTAPDFEVPVFKGSKEQMKDTVTPVRSPAAEFIVQKAMECENEPLYILGLGASTNISSAMLLEPKIKDKIAIVWLGCNQLDFGNAGEFNLDQDFYAAKVLYESDVVLVSYPASNVTSAMFIQSERMEEALTSGNNPLCDYLYEEWMEMKGDNEKYGRIVWDIAGTACLVMQDSAEQEIIKKPLLKDDYNYDHDNAVYDMIYTKKINPFKISEDMFSHIKTAGKKH